MINQDEYIDELPAAGAIGGTENVPIFQSGGTVQTTLYTIATYFWTLLAPLTLTLTNKRIVPRVRTVTYAANFAINLDNFDAFEQTAASGAISVDAPTGTPTDYQQFTISFLDDTTPRAISWHGAYQDYGGSLPAITVAGKVHTFLFQMKGGVARCIYSTLQP